MHNEEPLKTENSDPPKGILLKIFGIILLFVGGLNMVLLWRAGLYIDTTFILYILAGLGIYAIGMGRARYATTHKEES